MADFCLDPPLLAMDDHSLVSVRAQILMRKPGFTVCQSCINKQTFCTSVNLDYVVGEFSILDGLLRKIQGHLWVEMCESTEVICRPAPNVAEPLTAVELCAGLGAGSTAFETCAIRVQCFNDVNPKYCQWLSSKIADDQTVVCGDLTSSRTLKQISDAAPSSQFLSAGVSCQPFSSLGDQKQQFDDRSRSLPGTLKAGFHLQSTWILLECTKEARFSPWAQGVIDKFCRETGYRCEQQILDLHRTWPAHRTRWFAVLTHPHVPAVPIPSMPMLPWIPSILHLTPGVLPSTYANMDELRLDFHELKAFNETARGVHGSILNMCKPMSTATHSWGSQLRGCECGCRTNGFTNARLRDKGLYGQVVPLGEEFQHERFSFHAMRHLHPHEVALYNGLDPKYITVSGLGSARFELSGVGQMASPLQVGWIVANILFETNNIDHISVNCNPMDVMLKLFSQLFASRDELWGITTKTVYMDLFEQAVFKLVNHDCSDEGLSLTQQMFNQAVRFESQLARTARTAQITQNIMPAANPLPQVRRDDQVLPPANFSLRRSRATKVDSAAICDPWQNALHNSGDNSYASISATRLPMSETPFHAEPGDASDITGPSHVNEGEEVRGEEFESDTRLPMSEADSFHADPGSAPCTTGPAHNGVTRDDLTCDGTPHLPMTDPVFHADPPGETSSLGGPSQDPAQPFLAAAITDATDLKPTVAITQPDVEFPLPDSCDALHVAEPHPPMFASPVHAEPTGVPNAPIGPSHVDGNQDDLPTQPYAANGGLNFSTKRSRDLDDVEIHPETSAKALRLTELDPVDLEPTAPWSQPIVLDNYVERNFPQNGFLQGSIVVQVGINFGPLSPRKTHLLTLCQLLEAENSLHGTQFSCTDVLGRPLPPDGILIHNHIFLLFSQDADIRNLPIQIPPSTEDRLTSLWYQQGMVALDEMIFYLQNVQSEFPGISSAPVIFSCPASVDEQLDNIIGKAIEICAATGRPYASSVACLFEGHWFPLHVWVDQPQAHVYTTPEGFSQIFDFAPSFHSDGFVWHRIQIDSQHPLDCGFQCLQWLQKMVYYWDTVESMMGREMMTLKHEFAVAVHENRIPLMTFNPLGGAPEATIRANLVALLEQHGVARERSNQCATSLIDKLGLPQVTNIIGSKNAWRDLKAGATQLKPPFQIVLASELQASINARIANKQNFGHKGNKQTKPATSNKPIRIKPEHIALPDGIFQAEKQPIQHIAVSNIGANRTGIALVSIEEALPFFALQAPISAGGLAMIVLDHQDGRIPQGAETIKFPAQFKLTDEPVLLTGTLIQLGQQRVQRALPERPISVEEIPTCALRVLMYRDQVQESWDNVIKGPFRTITEHTAFDGVIATEIIDVWDRQFLDQHFKKTSGTQAFLFAVNVRLPHEKALQLLDRSATEGLYIEPRSDNGRYPCEKYSIVWLPKKSLSEVVLASQTATIKCWVVRNGLRYGLRVLATEAADLHKQYRPDIDYIAGGDKLTFRLGPFPWGTTKQSLQKLFKDWGWQARVGQPAGQDVENRGVFWTAVSTVSPSHWVFTMAHGDILISQVQQRETSSRPSLGVVASQRTMKQLTHAADVPNDPKIDPWLHQDPWGKSARPVQPPTLAKDQVEALTKQITQRVQENIGHGEDVAMHPDHESRVLKLEEQMKSLTSNFSQLHGSVGSFQAQQQQHNTQVGNQISAIKTQVESQASSLQGIIESKLDDQMNRMEALLSKRLKTHE